jgi:hypothetical protein
MSVFSSEIVKAGGASGELTQGGFSAGIFLSAILATFTRNKVFNSTPKARASLTAASADGL